MKKAFSFFYFFILTVTVYSQSLTLQWARSFGSGSNDYGKSVAVDNSGNVYTLGDFSGTMDVDPGPGVINFSPAGGFDIFISKLDAAGNFIWAKTVGGATTDMSVSIQLDNSGNIYYTGNFGGTVDFDPGPGVFNLSTGANGSAGFVSKLDANGNFLWAKQFENTDISSVTTDGLGNAYVTGGFYGITDFDPGPGTFNLTESGFIGIGTGVEDVFVLKLNSLGDFQWVKQMGGVEFDRGYSICADAAGNIFLGGHFGGVADFDPGAVTYNLTAVGFMDVFISKLDANGNFLWAKQVGGVMEDYCRDIAVDNSSNIYLSGNFYSAADFDPGPGVFNITPYSGQGDMFVLKLTASGNFVWAKQLGGTSEETNVALTLDALNNVYTTGQFRGTADFDPGPGVFNLTSNGYSDIFISKLDNNGNFLSAIRMGSVVNDDAGFDIKVDASRNIYTAGYYWGTVDFDPGLGVYNLPWLGFGDVFIQKLSQCPDITLFSITDTACGTYTLNTQTYTASGIYTQVLQNVAGCDSIITLHLSIGGSSNTVSATACNSYTWHGHTYLASGIYRDTLADRYGCDSISVLNLVIKNSVSTIINRVICAGKNYAGYTAQGTYIDTFTAMNGCDSIRTLNLSVLPRSYSSINISICQGQNYSGYTGSGVYTDTLVSANGCDSIRTLHLVVNPTYYKNINVSVCEGQSYFSGGAYQTTSGIYIDSLHTLPGCDSVIATHLTVHPLPVPLLGPDVNLCKGATIILKPGSFVSYEWQDQSVQPVYTANSTGTYWVKVTDNNNCKAADTIEIKKILPLPADFLMADDSICQYDKLQIRPRNSYNEYLWSTGSVSPFIMVESPGLYALAVKDNDGCMGSDSIRIFPKNCYSGVLVPNAFTPNGDGLNDFFKARVYGTPVSYQLLVFNRWGQLLFRTVNPQTGWDGKVNGFLGNTEVFTWLCQYQLEGSAWVVKKGTVLLLR